MAKVIVNGQEVQPTKKVKLTDHMSVTEIRDLLLQKQEELKNAQLSSNTEGN